MGHTAEGTVMSAQNLSPRSIRRIARSTGLDVVHGWSHGGYSLAFVTADHRHGWWNKISGEVRWDDNPIHYTSCRDRFPS